MKNFNYIALLCMFALVADIMGSSTPIKRRAHLQKKTTVSTNTSTQGGLGESQASEDQRIKEFITKVFGATGNSEDFSGLTQGQLLDIAGELRNLQEESSASPQQVVAFIKQTLDQNSSLTAQQRNQMFNDVSNAYLPSTATNVRTATTGIRKNRILKKPSTSTYNPGVVSSRPSPKATMTTTKQGSAATRKGRFQKKSTVTSVATQAANQKIRNFIQNTFGSNLAKLIQDGSVNVSVAVEVKNELQGLQAAANMPTETVISLIKEALNNNSNPFVSSSGRDSVYNYFTGSDEDRSFTPVNNEQERQRVRDFIRSTFGSNLAKLIKNGSVNIPVAVEVKNELQGLQAAADMPTETVISLIKEALNSNSNPFVSSSGRDSVYNYFTGSGSPDEERTLTTTGTDQDRQRVRDFIQNTFNSNLAKLLSNGSVNVIFAAEIKNELRMLQAAADMPAETIASLIQEALGRNRNPFIRSAAKESVYGYFTAPDSSSDLSIGGQLTPQEPALSQADARERLGRFIQDTFDNKLAKLIEGDSYNSHVAKQVKRELQALQAAAGASTETVNSWIQQALDNNNNLFISDMAKTAVSAYFVESDRSIGEQLTPMVLEQEEDNPFALPLEEEENPFG